ncbi:2,3-diphosphoglycerate-dependent phosphoglycerate mutase [Candidatus Woesearchaeota archaeon]|nr:2,3-diphosphoglycerate-dependent phosphoglycerate mutase [Candidatus Woesearchaeota archaeon]
MAYKVVFVRHGESLWNKKNLFTGWYDPPLTKKGISEARISALALKKKGYTFDIVFTNLHRRTLKTLQIILGKLRLKIPVKKTWRLNERHYGALIGLNKAATAKKYGEKQVLLWRRSYSVRPPALSKEDKRYKQIAKTYKSVPRKYLPLRESLADTYKRTIPYWNREIVPAIKSGKKVLVVASGNSLRSLIKKIDCLSEKQILKFAVPYCTPLVYEFDSKMKPKRHYYLAKAAEVKRTLAEMAAQGKAKK